jgi:nitrate/nitrite-specific signal transduction histidine kinase
LRIHVRDDGKGIDSEILAKGGVPGHWGMSGMRERAQKLGARLLVRSGAGSGTDVELDIPAAVAYRNRKSVPQWWNTVLGRRDAGDGHDE